MKLLLAIFRMTTLTVSVVLYTIFTWNYVASKFYYWFPSLPHFSILQIIAITFLICAIFSKLAVLEIKYEYRLIQVPKFLILPWVTLTIGYIFSLFI